MGSAIGYLIASKTKANVVFFDNSQDALKKAQSTIDKIANTSIEKGFLKNEEYASITTRIKYLNSLDEAAKADLVIEAIAENINAKKELFSNLDKICPAKTIFASNTSSLSITAIAQVTRRSKQFIGMHFFSPAHIMKLLEIIPGIDTDKNVIEKVKSYSESFLGKTVICSKDMPGFITTRLGLVLINEAAFALMEGLSTAKEIDLGMTLGYNHPMGPLALADFIGLDICLNIMETLYNGFGDPKYRACPLIRQLVAAGHLGKKTGRGFYEYNS